ncbi:MAG: hypothetical protein C0459_11975 [Chitinophaga sp.]|jgi:glycosyltransferase involved in cell wall biosynthesis|nr:hypothetical protein [Chitinophaga sp.]
MFLSVLIRNLNQAKEMELCLKALRFQIVSFPYEIVVVDNESNDNSVAIAKQYCCKIITLARSEFSYGKALNIGIENCSGEFVLSLSSHVSLLSQNFLERIPSLFSDERIAGLKFVPVTNNDIIRNSFLKGETIINSQFVNDSLLKVWANGIINNCSAIRKSVWQQIPFNEKLFYSEDKVWSFEVIKAGYELKINIPLFYQYNKAMSRQQLINKRANEEAAYRLFTKQAYKDYPPHFSWRFVYMLKEIRNAYVRMKTGWQVQRLAKQIVIKEKEKFQF